MQQLPLNIELHSDATFANFVVGENQLVLQRLEAICDGDSDFLYIYSEKGHGRSHLLQALTHAYSERNPDKLIAYLPLENNLLVPQMLDGLATFDCVSLDGIEQVLSDKEWQTAVFNLYNQLKEQGKSLLITGLDAPSQLDIELQDLKSRLSAMFIYCIKPLTDDQKRTLLQKKAKEKGLELSGEVAQYLLARQQRDLPTLLGILEKLDQASLQAKRKLTIPFLKEVLDL
ncbi:MAG: DnaA regulatory inactivator Hda [Kangiella sp.]|jgi:DnaA family protein|nr:DnaA regulatory inactivator Hda [Kangiella sp.]MCW9027314.1 DnaA regulatory inactivator Hda [Kangiella sp.]